MRTTIILIILLILGLSFSPAQAYWIWTPKTGKWINPKTAVKSTPEAQFELAKNLYDRKNYEEAQREFKKLLKHYPKSKEAAEGQYYLGLTEDAKGNLYDAYQAYQKVIDKYPFWKESRRSLSANIKSRKPLCPDRNARLWV